ncbi:MAG TPA: hypothetical protein VG672_20745 [Bryobacteraceae bacterium]|nr:hypothetical protein [Bryobacteraceae bacterium]
MKVGAEPKKVAILAGLGVVGLYLFYTNVLSDSSGSAPASSPAARPTVTRATETKPATAANPVRRSARRQRESEDFHPSLKLPEGEERPDPMTIDPTLRLDLLAKVQGVEIQGGQRNLFQFSTAPPPPLKGPEPMVKPKTPLPVAAAPQPGTAPGGIMKPPPPPINLKYYGYSSVRGDSRRRAFFLDGDEIFVATEGEVVKKRYRVVRIGVNSVVMEDTESKHQQTLPLQAEVVG